MRQSAIFTLSNATLPKRGFAQIPLLHDRVALHEQQPEYLPASGAAAAKHEFPIRLRIRRLTTPFDALQARLLLHDLFLLADEEQALLIRHRLHGCSLAETARREGMSIKRVRHRLKALYRAYFAQEKTKQKEL